MSVATSGMEGPEGRVGEGCVKDAILIAGPTASGKSALAVDLAERTGGVVINTDSMQGYAILDVLTARPGAADLSRVPHFLYGHVHPSFAYSTGAWLRDVSRLIGEGRLAGRPAIFVGGTGLYFRALADGIPQMPDIPAAIRQHWRATMGECGAPYLHDILTRRDPEAARQLRASDGQRIVRALEVLEASGRSILAWQKDGARPLIDRASARFLVIEPDRAALVDRIERRFDAMVANGALEEVRQLSALGLDPTLPAMKAIGVRELQAALAGTTSIAAAIERAKVATRQYAKRQATWFRHQLGSEWRRLGPSDDMETTI